MLKGKNIQVKHIVYEGLQIHKEIQLVEWKARILN